MFSRAPFSPLKATGSNFFRDEHNKAPGKRLEVTHPLLFSDRAVQGMLNRVCQLAVNFHTFVDLNKSDFTMYPLM